MAARNKSLVEREKLEKRSERQQQDILPFLSHLTSGRAPAYLRHICAALTPVLIVSPTEFALAELGNSTLSSFLVAVALIVGVKLRIFSRAETETGPTQTGQPSWQLKWHLALSVVCVF